MALASTILSRQCRNGIARLQWRFRRCDSSVLLRSLSVTTGSSEEGSRYPGHVPISPLQKGVLTIGSAVAALHDPYRHDMVAVLGETTGEFAAKHMMSQMLASEEGREVLKEKPRITSASIELDKLLRYPEGTFGRTYADFMAANRISPDTRAPVRFVDDPQLAYVIQRYREVHDFWHTLLDMPTNLEGEIAVKWFEAVHTRLPMCALGAVFGPLRMSSEQRRVVREKHIPWAVQAANKARPLMAVYYERRFHDNMGDLRRELNISPMDSP